MVTRESDDKKSTQLDVLVAGAGYVGLATAVSIKQARPNLHIAIVDAAPAEVWRKDGRASAIAAAACRMLDQLGCWEEIAPEAQAITDMIITDSKSADPVRPVFLTFDGEIGAGEPFAHMIENRLLNGALRRRAAELGIDIIEGVAVQAFEAGTAGAKVHLADGISIDTRLLIAADGVNSRLRDMAGIKTVRWEYGQSGIVCTVIHERPHGGRAEEHFLPAGPFATLPLKPTKDGTNRSSIVWTERTEDADKLVAGDAFVFEIELEQRFGLKLGEIRVEGKPRAWPLGLTLARAFVASRFALAGDAAHGIHPIAGQGLNLGFKDAAALAETIVEADRLGQDIGAIDVLERYEQWRRFDTVRMGITTDVLNRLFSNDIAPVRAIRDIGLGLVDRVPRLKDYFIRQASGLTGETPRLLKGEAI
ncbi:MULTISPECIES: ubiquinone biosynthesis hydroxylase [Aminobacter]|jgi:2-octaprenyl-6-methoxyphenol hydroxylase|uniref:2-octaprenyl-6-methoxyphenol hydroxylase n=2 Tax=Aminobacter TaxID=31988 RepID=A0AAC8YKE6_AMIAI|nr:MULTISPECIES: ubiquinone biosynthesis hydroxylase [Aminobacter]AMS39952.1 2-octaprenyl-6-methoxyphenyl hydroxylase [Aminobacter aminovorans]MBA8906279.1 2-octaprenyl-6-methoxyphenol hydroxylase [Aminobacter ciceronei]MBA9020058.1 2-octaprenyl-6-methoxyphenol hydroxylase [Aminobacter ciceronei]MBB3707240.1 2-octaprenyl-6-methoxyphenol hydroxylase [Aminobacter aminovorans]WMC96765.1 ubiquinone biosynthesis hydroxylase [Aminobacter aminovorans]